MEAASQEQQPGNPFKMEALLGSVSRDYKSFSGHSDDTSNCLVADKWGNVVAATPSGWGGVAAGETGLQLGQSYDRTYNMGGPSEHRRPGQTSQNYIDSNVSHEG